MKFIKNLPYNSILDNDELECSLWQSDKNICEMQDTFEDFRGEKSNGACDTSGFYYGTSDSNEPKFCARHFYQSVVSGDGKGNYTLKDN